MALKLSKKTNKVKKVIKKVVPKSTQKVATGKKSPVESLVTLPTGKYSEAVGRRKVASARVRLYEDGGDFVINGKVAGQYFSSILNASKIFNEPFNAVGLKSKFGVNITVSGSGIGSQLGAVVHAISRALIVFNPDFRPLLKERERNT
jgi:small subunit ribosomal protein S9